MTITANAVDAPLSVRLDSFAEATPDQLAGDFARLVEAVWAGGVATDAAPAAIPDLVAALAASDAPRQARLAFLLGLLAEAIVPAEPVGPAGPQPSPALRQTVREGLCGYLDLLAAQPEGGPLQLALLFLVAHFPADRDEILAATSAMPLSDEDRGRLERSLSPVDLADPAVTRVWPHPGVWSTLDESDRARDRQWMCHFPPEQIAMAWELDTRSLLAYSGAKALWATAYGPLATGPEPDLTLPAVAGPTVAERDPLGGYGEALRCPACKGKLAAAESAARCTGCEAEYAVVNGHLDLSMGVGDPHEPMTRTVPMRYSDIRPAFLRWKGSNWSGQVPVEREDEYLRTHVRPVDGPVLDMAAGTGRWTSVIAELVGPDRVIALDLSKAMLDEVVRAQPGVYAVRGSALALPFEDASLGAVNCWNALQSLPDPAAAVAEVGRCLRPGGTFTIMTFRPSLDPHYRYLQNRPFGVVPVNLSDPVELRASLTAAGLTIREQFTPGSFLFITAVREAAAS